VANEMVVLGPQEGLPELFSFDVRLITTPQLSVPGKALAESIRDFYGQMTRAAA